MSSFNPLVPTGLVKLNSDYRNLQANFQQLDTSFAVNHFAFSSDVSNGKHTFVELVNNVSIPTATASGEVTLYGIQDPSTLITDEFATPDDSGNPYQITNFGTSAQWNKFGATTRGWTFLPGGLIMNYGFQPISGSTPTTGLQNFSRNYTNPASVNIVFGGFYNGSVPTGSVTITYSLISSSGTATGFNWAASGNSNHYDGFSWFAMGF